MPSPWGRRWERHAFEEVPRSVLHSEVETTLVKNFSHAYASLRIIVIGHPTPVPHSPADWRPGGMGRTPSMTGREQRRQQQQQKQQGPDEGD